MPDGQQRGACCVRPWPAWWSLSLVAEVGITNTLGFLPREPHRSSIFVVSWQIENVYGLALDLRRSMANRKVTRALLSSLVSNWVPKD